MHTHTHTSKSTKDIILLCSAEGKKKNDGTFSLYIYFNVKSGGGGTRATYKRRVNKFCATAKVERSAAAAAARQLMEASRE